MVAARKVETSLDPKSRGRGKAKGDKELWVMQETGRRFNEDLLRQCNLARQCLDFHY